MSDASLWTARMRCSRLYVFLWTDKLTSISMINIQITMYKHTLNHDVLLHLESFLSTFPWTFTSFPILRDALFYFTVIFVITHSLFYYDICYKTFVFSLLNTSWNENNEVITIIEKYRTSVKMFRQQNTFWVFILL